ncbi:MAG: type II toxin-antitoxin system prevent-host-death family antitoxin [Eubacteriaceae bacterium]|nr:type II toxin-antitoxin system prevent-host-death family antitoxin [Eubacteriaceae bacterium]
MQIALSDLKINVGKYVDLANTEDVIITKYGKPVAKIIRYDKEPWYMKNLPEKITSIDSLFGTLPNDIGLADMGLERLTECFA